MAQPCSELDLSSSKRGGGAGFSSSLIAGSLVKPTGSCPAAPNHRGREVDLERLVCRGLGVTLWARLRVRGTPASHPELLRQRGLCEDIGVGPRLCRGSPASSCARAEKPLVGRVGPGGGIHPSSSTLSAAPRPPPTCDPHSRSEHHLPCSQVSGSRGYAITCASSIDVLLPGRVSGDNSELLGRYGAHGPSSPGRGSPSPSLTSAPVTRALTSR